MLLAPAVKQQCNIAHSVLYFAIFGDEYCVVTPPRRKENFPSARDVAAQRWLPPNCRQTASLLFHPVPPRKRKVKGERKNKNSLTQLPCLGTRAIHRLLTLVLSRALTLARHQTRTEGGVATLLWLVWGQYTYYSQIYELPSWCTFQLGLIFPILFHFPN